MQPPKHDVMLRPKALANLIKGCPESSVHGLYGGNVPKVFAVPGRLDKLRMGCRGPGDQDMMHLSVPEHHMASMAATLQPDMHHQKQDQVCLPAISFCANPCDCSALLELLK